jgi:hypothetical protein
VSLNMNWCGVPRAPQLQMLDVQKRKGEIQAFAHVL